MSFLSDLFDGPQKAAQAQIAGIQQGLGQAQNSINGGNQALTTNYTSALQPFLQNYAAAQPGVGALGNALGLNGPAGNQSALAALQTTPGYQFQKQQGDNAINAAAAANGTLNSGNQDLALSNYNQGLAGTTYNNYVSQLQPYLGASATAAGGIGNTYTGLGNNLNANSNTLAGLDMNAATGVGNAQANADLATQQNTIGGLLGLAKLGTNTVGGGALNGIGSSLMSIFSDERLKEDIEPVGELFDGQKIYSYHYKGDPVPRIGLMAQEVERHFPDAVTEIGGFKAVDYGKATGFAADLARLADGDQEPERAANDSYTSIFDRFMKEAA